MSRMSSMPNRSHTRPRVLLLPPRVHHWSYCSRSLVRSLRSARLPWFRRRITDGLPYILYKVYSKVITNILPRYAMGKTKKTFYHLIYNPVLLSYLPICVLAITVHNSILKNRYFYPIKHIYFFCTNAQMHWKWGRLGFLRRNGPKNSRNL